MKKEKQDIEYRFYNIPEGEYILALMGEKWIQVYGKNIRDLHFHNYVEIGICYYGKGTLVLKDQMYRFSRDCFVIIPAYCPHTTVSDNNEKAYWEWFYIDLNKIISDINYMHGKNYQLNNMKLGEKFKQPMFFFQSEHIMLANYIRAIRMECLRKGLMHVDCLRGLLQAFTVELLRHCIDSNCEEYKHKKSMLIEPALKYVEENYFETIKIARLASECNTSESHFRRMFNKSMNMAPNDYINLIRIQHACDLLKQTRGDVAIKEIAYRVGFDNVSTFNRNFKKIMDMTPLKWKNSQQKDYINDFNINTLKGW